MFDKMKEIKLSQEGKNRDKYIALVDDEDFEWLNQWNWFVRKSKKLLYAARNVRINGKLKMIHLHREIMSTPQNMEVDHQDRNGLNCQRSNMRNCTASQNQVNKRFRLGKSEYRGVTITKSGYARAFITMNHKRYHLGCFKTRIEVAHKYDEMAKILHGEFANLNFESCVQV